MLDRYRISSIRHGGYYFCFVVLIFVVTMRCLFPATINNGWITELKLLELKNCRGSEYRT